MKHTIGDLRQRQSLPLDAKVQMTKQRIREWYEHYDGQVYVSFSGGKDSTVLLNIAREIYPDIEAVFVDTGLEYPEIRQFVKSFDNVTILRPKMRFDEVIKKYGYPIISKEVSECVWAARFCSGEKYKSQRIMKLSGELKDHNGNASIYNLVKYKPLIDVEFKISNKCCNVMKKLPVHTFAKKSGKKPITAQMASESRLRQQQWLNNGCNGFDMKTPISNPMSIWTEQDVLSYIKNNNIKLASVYGDIVSQEQIEQLNLFGENECKLKTTGCDRTGCIFCGFGCHLDKEPTRFQRLKKTHPRQYEYCIGGGEYDENGIWIPNKQGLGLGKVFDDLNKIYGEDFIKYK